MATNTDIRRPAQPDGRRILIVEDEDAARAATRDYLRYRGYAVADAATVDESLVKADALRPDVVICDWKLAGKRDGIHVARLLRERYGVAVIFVTAYALADLRDNIRDMGAVDCLRKPISLSTLAAVLESISATPRH